jgi:hypothetical protein
VAVEDRQQLAVEANPKTVELATRQIGPENGGNSETSLASIWSERQAAAVAIVLIAKAPAGVFPPVGAFPRLVRGTARSLFKSPSRSARITGK